MSLARDTAIVFDHHDARLTVVETRTADHERKLEQQNRKFDEHGGFFAMLDRKEQHLREDLKAVKDQINARLDALDSRLVKIFTEVREAARTGKNGR